MALESHFNYVKYDAYQDSQNFFGVFGLGERVSTNLNYPDGIYSMYNRDVSDSFETGKLPGHNQ